MLQTFSEKNRDLLININGQLVHRNEAGISPFDSVVQGGDAVWEGLRLYDGRIFKLTEHLDRLRSSAGALAFHEIPPHSRMIDEIKRTLEGNQMRDGVHIRLTLTRGVKITSGMDPRLNQSGPTLIVLAEHKPPVYDRSGLTLITSSVRRFPPDCLDPKIHHANLIQSILAKIQANAAGADDALLSRLFHTAIRVGRRARAETEIGHHSLSISSIAAQQVRALLPHIERAAVLVLGAGEAGRLAAEALVDRGIGEMTVANRTHERAEDMARELGGRAVPFDRLLDALAESDVMIAASGSQHYLIDRGQIVEVMSRRDGRPLLILDIGMPRDVDPAVRELPNVTYRDLDDLQAIAAKHFGARKAEVTRVLAIIEVETQRFTGWWEQLQIIPTISALTERAERLRRIELEKSLHRLRLSEEQSEQVEALTKALVKQILHDPIATLRERGDREIYVDAVRTLFHLDEPLHPVPDV